MGKLKGVLTSLNDILGPFPIYNYINGGVCVQYGTGGAGTIVLEASLDEQDDSSIQWTQIQMKNPNDIAGAPIANLAAAGLGVADVVGFRLIRVRKSVAGIGPVTVSMSVGIG